ncbi:MAG: hypothetical protein ACOY15_13090 [Pseudomonadota bacterium]
MAENVTNELIYEVLKHIQDRLAKVESTLTDHTRQFIRVREDINSVREDINGLRGDDLRREAMQARMDERLQRIENRLNLTDA